ATGIANSSCAAGTSLTSIPGVPVVIYSTGKNGAQGSAGIDETANLDGTNINNNRTFVSRDPAPTFDDLVLWISSNILVNRMVAAGKLP
ncbi:MAG: prepilin-type cleavage/methylation domain-containing protein, partial [Gallionella sp.]